MTKRLLMFCFIALSGGLASAADYNALLTEAMVNNSGGTYMKYASYADACANSSTNATITKTPEILAPANRSTNFKCRWTTSTGAVSYVNNSYMMFSCPYGGAKTLIDGGYVCVGGTPPPPPPPPCPISPQGEMELTTAYATGAMAGSALAKKIIPDGGLNGARYCSGQCIIAPDGPPSSCHTQQTPGPNGYFRVYCKVPMATTGTQCEPGPADNSPNGDTLAPPAGTPPEPPGPNISNGSCPAGSTPSGQDSMGMTICVGTAKPPTPPTTTTEKPDVTTSNPDGGSTTIKESTRSNSDGTTTTTTTTTVTAPDGSKSTTVTNSTTTKPDGSKGVEDKPEDKSDLCKQNPHLTVCKNSQVMGTCGEVTCSGDAIQCATLRAAAAMECKQREETDLLMKSPQYALGSAAAAGADPQKDSLPASSKASSVAMPSSLDGSGWLGAGSPFTDKTFVVQGHTITIPFSKVMQYLVVLRYALMVIALLVSFRILSGAIIRE